MTDIIAGLSREFPKEKISWRAQNVTQDGTRAMALAYLDARDVMNRLDHVVGPFNWQCKYSHAEGKTVCDLGIRRSDGTVFISDGGKCEEVYPPEWVWKADGAGDSDIEAEKGALSDAFKRAAVRWGIGRYLYDLDAPWVPCESYKGNDGKWKFKKFTDDPWKHVRGPLATHQVEPPAKPIGQTVQPTVATPIKPKSEVDVFDPKTISKPMAEKIKSAKTMDELTDAWVVAEQQFSKLPQAYIARLEQLYEEREKTLKDGQNNPA